MSGGFFRGTSADQDTRFSNKQAKLLKSQKFAPELDNLIDMTKVKMDVIRPWIANRVTEILGFEDEVLINFIYGLVDRKGVNGKEVQIQLTGFMEKSTGKFMKELWVLLLSAQNNATGVPQQFLDAKEEEIRKKKVEADRITQEIQKKKEAEQEKPKKMVTDSFYDGEVGVSKATDDASDPISKHLPSRASSAYPKEDKEADSRNDSRGKNRFSRPPLSASPSSQSGTPSRSKSFSNSRSYSSDRHKTRSMSRSPQPRGRSISLERRYRSPRKRSISRRRRNSPQRPWSPLRRRSPYSSTLHSRCISPSPVRRRLLSLVWRRSPSPMRRRLPSLVRHRSPSPLRRRSPPPMHRRSSSLLRRRSPSPVRRRSPNPVCRGSPAPSRRRSPSPQRWRSPPRLRSPSLVRRRSPPPRYPKHRRRSPLRSPRQRNRSHSSYGSRSPAYRSRRSLSGDRDICTNGVESRRCHDDYASQRTRGKRSPVHPAPVGEEVDRSGRGFKGPDPMSRRPPISMRSPQQDPRDWSDARQKKPVLLPSPGKSPSRSESSQHTGKLSSSEDRSQSENPTRQKRERVTRADGASPMRQTREWIPCHDNPETGGEEEIRHAREDRGCRTDSPRRRLRQSPAVGGRKKFPSKDFRHKENSPEGLAGCWSGEAQGRPDNIDLRNEDRDRKSEKASMWRDHPGSPTQQSYNMLEEIEYGPGRIEGRSRSLDHGPDEHPSAKQLERDSPSSSERLQKSYSREGYKADEKKRLHSSNALDSDQGHTTDYVQKSMKKVDCNYKTGSFDFEYEENEKRRPEDMEKRKHKRSERREMILDDEVSYDSQIDRRKEAKRKRKEEKRLRKEERHRRREERHCRREHRRAGKLKAKSMDTVAPPSDFEKSLDDADDSDGDVAARGESCPSDTEETDSLQKKLEIELRKKALESLRAKKGINP